MLATLKKELSKYAYLKTPKTAFHGEVRPTMAFSCDPVVLDRCVYYYDLIDHQFYNL